MMHTQRKAGPPMLILNGERSRACCHRDGRPDGTETDQCRPANVHGSRRPAEGSSYGTPQTIVFASRIQFRLVIALTTSFVLILEVWQSTQLVLTPGQQNDHNIKDSESQ